MGHHNRKRHEATSWFAAPAGHHGFGRDGSDDGEGSSPFAREFRARTSAGRPAGYPVRLPGERERDRGRAVTYFRESLHAAIAVRDWRTAPGPDGKPEAQFAGERLVTTVRDSRYVFAGPGSPSYALEEVERDSHPEPVDRETAARRLCRVRECGGLDTRHRDLPVYEIYKCGDDPFWLEGLDVTSAAGIRAAIIPHYDNNEGGTHDTRFCYLGERRLSIMERSLPEGAFVLGVDEHTACTFDLDAGTATVEGRGVVTVRAAGRSATLPNGEVFPSRGYSRRPRPSPAGALTGTKTCKQGKRADDDEVPASNAVGLAEPSPLVDLVREHEADFAAAVASRDMALPRVPSSNLSETSRNGRLTFRPETSSIERTPVSVRSSWSSDDCRKREVATLARSSDPLSKHCWSSATRQEKAGASLTPTSCGNTSPS